LINLITIHSY